MPGTSPGLEVVRKSLGTPAEFLPSRFERYRNLALSSKIGIWIPGVVTADVGAVEYGAENSLVSEVPRDVEELRDMHETDPFPLPLYPLERLEPIRDTD
jgi:hypothetical protein